MRFIDLLSGEIGLFVVLALLLLVAIVIAQSSLPKPLRVLIVIALFLRVGGSLARLSVLVDYYGVGDAMAYYQQGVLFAPFFQGFDWEPITNSEYWGVSGHWYGTTFMFWASGIVIALIGPTMLGEFIVFSMLSFLGLVAFCVAFRRSFSTVPILHYARWVWLFPSLWFWPSSVGKEAVVMLGLGLAVLGFIGVRNKIHWIPLTVGTALLYAIRPQLAALFALAAFLAFWLGRWKRWTPQGTLQAVVMAAVSVAVVWLGLRTTGLEAFDLAGMQEYVQSEPGREVGGQSEIVAPEASLTGIPVAISNVLFRPFPWEAGSLVVLASSLELVFLWTLVLIRRRRLIQSLRGWRSSRLLCLSGVFIVLYATSFGMMAANLGIIARQRIILFPLLFVFLEAVVPSARAVPRRFRTAMPAPPPSSASPGVTGWPAPTRDTARRSSSR